MEKDSSKIFLSMASLVRMTAEAERTHAFDTESLAKALEDCAVQSYAKFYGKNAEKAKFEAMMKTAVRQTANIFPAQGETIWHPSGAAELMESVNQLFEPEQQEVSAKVTEFFCITELCRMLAEKNNTKQEVDKNAIEHLIETIEKNAGICRCNEINAEMIHEFSVKATISIIERVLNDILAVFGLPEKTSAEMEKIENVFRCWFPTSTSLTSNSGTTDVFSFTVSPKEEIRKKNRPYRDLIIYAYQKFYHQEEREKFYQIAEACSYMIYFEYTEEDKANELGLLNTIVYPPVRTGISTDYLNRFLKNYRNISRERRKAVMSLFPVIRALKTENISEDYLSVRQYKIAAEKIERLLYQEEIMEALPFSWQEEEKIVDELIEIFMNGIVQTKNLVGEELKQKENSVEKLLKEKIKQQDEYPKYMRSMMRSFMLKLTEDREKMKMIQDTYSRAVMFDCFLSGAARNPDPNFRKKVLKNRCRRLHLPEDTPEEAVFGEWLAAGILGDPFPLKDDRLSHLVEVHTLFDSLAAVYVNSVSNSVIIDLTLELRNKN